MNTVTNIAAALEQQIRNAYIRGQDDMRDRAVAVCYEKKARCERDTQERYMCSACASGVATLESRHTLPPNV